ncbi:ankyrin-1-like [Anthonomus grandis grandis]|uniref:ankyrin-1-like n=1 Tax=Anthonomus grandis grandis TaxID=2921223 RepID=UPI0021661DAF|nr:ankyrin-1-like [Anthonomus grandis grandis]
MYKHISNFISSGYLQNKKKRDQRFFLAVSTGDLKTITQLINDGYDPNTINDDDLTALHILAEKGDMTTAKYFLTLPSIDVNSHINIKNEDTPLILSIYFHQFNFTNLLLRYGANPNIGNIRARTPIFRAVQLRNTAVLKVLLFAKAQVDVLDTFGNTPLSLSVIEYPSIRVATMLLKWGANPNIRSMKSIPILSELCLNCHSIEHLSMVKLLINYNANVNITNPLTKWTPLHIVSITGYVSLAKMLLEHGANRNLKDKMGRTPYDIAIEHQHADLIEMYKEGKKIVQALLKSISITDLEKPSTGSFKKGGKGRTVRFSMMEKTESDDELLLQNIKTS